jgi:hypothetical protein
MSKTIEIGLQQIEDIIVEDACAFHNEDCGCE